MLDDAERKERIALKHRRKGRAELWALAAIILPIVAYGFGFGWIGPYLFTAALFMGFAYIVDGQIESAVREPRDH